jgi:hypothetical protein
MSYYYQLTDYPHIYGNTYWGSSTIKKRYTLDTPNLEIIKNRNDFIKRFKITKYKKLTLLQWEKDQRERPSSLIIDHKEYYENINGCMILVCSQYNPYPLFKQMKPIYALDQWSGYQIVETTKSKKLLMKQIFDKFPPEISKYIQEYLKYHKTSCMYK